MTRQAPRNTLGQNRIDYIVYHNTREASDFLASYGFISPENPRELSEAIKELVRKKGRQVLEKLLALHPDKNALESALIFKEKPFCKTCQKRTRQESSNFCGVCGSVSIPKEDQEDSFLEDFTSYSDTELEGYYKRVLADANKEPEDKTLALELQTVWNALRKRKEFLKESKAIPKETTKHLGITKTELLLFGMVFIAGALVGHSIQQS